MFWSGNKYGKLLRINVLAVLLLLYLLVDQCPSSAASSRITIKREAAAKSTGETKSSDEKSTATTAQPDSGSTEPQSPATSASPSVEPAGGASDGDSHAKPALKGNCPVAGMDKRSPSDPLEVVRLTTKSGAPIGDKMNSLLVGAKGPNLLADVAFIEESAHFNRERIPERVVHAKGGAAFGHFVVTNTEISKYSKAALFSALGKRTPVAARFSHVAGESGGADTVRDVRGFAVKFYTELGNWDLVGNNFPVFFIRDPINFASFIHSQKRNPATHLKDPDAFWDFVALVPESLHAIVMLFSERGTPDGFRHMHGFGVNTFKLINEKGEPFYAKFHWVCDQGIRNLESEAATRICGLDPDYSIRDLFVNIGKGNNPSWTLKFQVMSLAEAAKAEFNVLDVTKTWPTAKSPLIEVGKMVLEKNVENFFAHNEQLAFSPSNMVSGIEASPDKMLMGRMFSYPDAQRYRLGANYADIPVNQPRCPVMTPTYNDGVTFMSNMNSSMPNYVPSIRYKNMALVDERFVEHKQTFEGHTGRFDLSQDDNYSQPRVLVNKVLDHVGRKKLATNIGEHLKMVSNKEISKRVLNHFNEINPELSANIAKYVFGGECAVAAPASTTAAPKQPS